MCLGREGGEGVGGPCGNRAVVPWSCARSLPPRREALAQLDSRFESSFRRSLGAARRPRRLAHSRGSRFPLVPLLGSTQCRCALSLLHLSHFSASLMDILFITASQRLKQPERARAPGPPLLPSSRSPSRPSPSLAKIPHLDHLRRPRPRPVPLPLPRPARRLLGAPRAELAPVQDALVRDVGDDLRASKRAWVSARLQRRRLVGRRGRGDARREGARGAPR